MCSLVRKLQIIISSCSQCFPYQTGFERHFWQSGVWWALGEKIGTIVFLSVRVIQIKWVKDFESRRALLLRACSRENVYKKSV